MSDNITRRPLKSRNTEWAKRFTHILLKTGIQPNQISVLSVVFSAISCALFLLLASENNATYRILFYFLAALFIQLRLLCNLMDGLLAVEGGLKSKTGEIFNEIPDRFSDLFILTGAGYSVSSIPYGMDLGWLAAGLSILTAYIRAFAGSIGTEQHFTGPMAKQQRMAIITIACFISMFSQYFIPNGTVIYFALILIVIGALITIFRRVNLMVKELK